jgi:DtxR family Mn-dependent transcriptional regulator
MWRTLTVAQHSLTDNPTPAVEDYLKTIHDLGGTDTLVSPYDIAERLGVRSPSVTGMLKRLAEMGWIVYELRHGAHLTSAGITQARKVLRRHRLIELFLIRVLGLDWSEVDTEAEVLEHAVSARLEQALAAYLGEPAESPHGHLIPTIEGKLAERRLQPLTKFQLGQRIVIREVCDESSERLQRWKELGLLPGKSITLLRHDPLDNLYELRVDNRAIRLGAAGLTGLSGELFADH